MADIGKRVGPVAGTGANATLYTCAAALGFLWRHMSVVNTTGGALTFKMAIAGSTATAGNRIYSDQSVPANFALDWSGLRYIANTETIQWDAPSGLTVVITGVEQN